MDLKTGMFQPYQQQERCNDQIKATNDELQRYSQGNTHISWWSCKWVEFSRQVVMHEGGVYLNHNVDMLKYYNTILTQLYTGLTVCKYVVLVNRYYRNTEVCNFHWPIKHIKLFPS